jgi:hypothetical protein
MFTKTLCEAENYNKFGEEKIPQNLLKGTLVGGILPINCMIQARVTLRKDYY